VVDRANGEHVRLAYELANIKRQVEETWTAERIENHPKRRRRQASVPLDTHRMVPAAVTY
jgi:hypothetical protein